VGAARKKGGNPNGDSSGSDESNVKIGPTKLLINGKWVDSVSGKTFPTIQSFDGPK